MSDESLNYAKGYAAGQRKVDIEERRARRTHERHMARMTLAASIAPAILEHPWVDGAGKRLNNAAGIAGTVADLVKAIEGKLT